ncbi:hypothetical protein VZ94_07420 [Methylocucumis oryzae]|uniref:Uncharacterized protein n=2 Tax=Methylocucumis oryzae TaxID=1632867 RepID=A0A0F3IJS1_9GAMM|nr:hypothetical protein VZ94_07420 [Methylocucumis oryzae]
MLPPKLTLEQQAKLNKLPGMLCISDIATLRYSTEKELIEHYSFQIAEACLAGELEYKMPRPLDWGWLCEHPEQKPMLEVTIDYESSPLHDSPEYENEKSCWYLESEWEGDSEPKPAYKYQDPLSKLKRFNANNWNSSAFEVYRYEYATGRRCMISAKDFKQWLISKKDFPLPNDCLLISWINIEPQTKTLGDAGAVNKSKPRKKSEKCQEEENGRPKERQAFFFQIWEQLDSPKRNNKIWLELKKSKNEDGPITQVYGNEEFHFKYQDGAIELLARKTFQNDMTAIRRKK